MAKKVKSQPTSSSSPRKATGKAVTKTKKVSKKTASGKTPVKAKKTVKKTSKPAVKPAAKGRPKVAEKAKPKKTASSGRKNNTPKLSKSTLRKFHQMLLEKRRALVGDMSGIEAETIGVSGHNASGGLSNVPTHPAELGTDNYEHEFSLGLLESERAMLNEIDEALMRIEKGTYGICMGTGKLIGDARLKAKPWAKYSIEYARMIEKGLVRPGQEDEELDS